MFLVKSSPPPLDKQIQWLNDLPVFLRLVIQRPKFLVTTLAISDLKANAGSPATSLFLSLDTGCFVLFRVYSRDRKELKHPMARTVWLHFFPCDKVPSPLLSSFSVHASLWPPLSSNFKCPLFEEEAARD